MAPVPMWRRYLRFWGPNPAADIDTELDFHIEELTKRFIASGLTPADARAETLRRFGDVARVRSDCLKLNQRWQRERRTRRSFDALVQDVQYGLRVFRRRPAFSTGAALVLALGIGANTTIYSTVKALMFPDVPIEEAHRVVRLFSENPTRGIYFSAFSERDVAALNAQAGSFGCLAAFTREPVTLTGVADPERLQAIRGTVRVLDCLGVSPAQGRRFLLEDTGAGGNPVAIVSHRAWLNRFGGDPTIVGRTIRLEGRQHVIVGVMPERFWFVSRDVDAWLLLPEPRADGAAEPRRLSLVARFAPAATASSAQAEVETLSQRLAREHPSTNDGWTVRVTGLQPLGPGEERFFALLIIIVSLLLAATCAHVATLFLAHGIDRKTEIAVRVALGARRARIVRQLLVESTTLALAGSVCSVLVAVPALTVLRAVLGSRTPYLAELSFDGVALSITAGLAITSSLLFGVLPAFRVSRWGVIDALKQSLGAGDTGTRGQGLNRVLIASEGAVATILAIVAILFVRSAQEAQAVDVGFRVDGVITFGLEASASKYAEPSAAARAFEDVLDRIHELPAVTSAGAATRLPMQLGVFLAPETITIADHRDVAADKQPWAITSTVTPGYFESIGIPLMQGRSFTRGDSATSLPVAVISRAMAQAYWPGGSPVGKLLKYGAADAPGPWLTVIGVVSDVRPLDPTLPPALQLYVPLSQRPARALTYFVKTTDDPAGHAGEIAVAVRKVDSEWPILNARTMADVMADISAGMRLGGRMLTAFAVVAVLLAAIGVASVLAYAAARRKRELAVRTALGATPASLRRLLLRQAVRPSLMGIAVGLVLSALITRGMAVMLYNVSPTDPLTYLSVTLLLATVAMAASYLPARRAAKGDPNAALRCE